MENDEIEIGGITDAFVINNSGLVILAPFLPRYFDMLEMVKDDAFVDEQAAVRAVQHFSCCVTPFTPPMNFSNWANARLKRCIGGEKAALVANC